MTACDCLREARSLGVHLEAAGDRLRVKAPKGVLTPDLIDRLRAHKKELLLLLRAEDSQARFGSEAAGLYRWIGARVVTPDGPGRLLAAFTTGAEVLLDRDPERTHRFPLADVRTEEGCAG